MVRSLHGSRHDDLFIDDRLLIGRTILIVKGLFTCKSNLLTKEVGDPPIMGFEPLVSYCLVVSLPLSEFLIESIYAKLNN